jgi:hypothetical protein
MREHVMLLVLAGAAGCGTPPTVPTPVPPTSTAATQPPAPPAPPTPTPSGDPLEGRYALELSIDKLSPECDRVPDTVRHLTYSAAIESTGEANYTITLSGGAFLTGSICDFVPSHLGCNQFSATRSGDGLRFDLINDNDDGHGGHLVAQVAQGTWFELIGSTNGVMSNGTITSQGSGSLWYCAASLGYPFPCPSYVGCAIGDLRMNFARLVDNKIGRTR